MMPHTLILALLLAALPSISWASDDDAAATLARKSGCMKCHGVDKKKDGPSLQEIAKKYRGRPDAEAKVVAHITSNPMVKIDGKQEEHEAIKSRDANAVANVAKWILSR